MIQPSIPNRFARAMRNMPKPIRNVRILPAIPPGNAGGTSEDHAVRMFWRTEHRAPSMTVPRQP